MSVEREIGDLIRTIAHEKKESVCAAIVTSVEENTCTVERVSDGRKLEKVSLNSSSNEEDSLIITPVIGSQVLIASVNEHHWFVRQYSQIEKVTLNTTKQTEEDPAGNIEVNAVGNIKVNGEKEIKINIADTIIKINGENDEKGIEINAAGNIKVKSDKNIEINAAEKIVIKGEGNIEINAEDIIETNGGTNGGLVILGKLQNNLEVLKKYCEDMTSAISIGLSAILVNTPPNSLLANGTLGAEAFDNAMTGKKIDFDNMRNDKITH